jgi:hypothetical protein
MQRLKQHYIIGFQSTTLNFHNSDPLTSTTSLLCNSSVPLKSSTAAKTTAALIPSTAFPGVDIVIYETVDNEQL